MHAQVFQPGDFVLNAGNGAAVFHLHASDTAGYDKDFNGVGGINLNFRGEFGVAPWLGFSMSVSHTSLITQTFFSDDICNLTEIAPGINYHVPWKNRWIDLQGEIGAGYLRYFFDSNGGLFVRTSMTCLTFFAGIHPRLYFTRKQRFGGYAYYRFSAFTGGGETTDKFTSTYKYDVDGSGHTFGLGLFYRFGKPRTNEPADPNETK